MTARRPLAFAGLAVVATVLVTGCGKPPQRITVQSGTTSMWVAPAAECSGGTAYTKPGDCGDTGTTGPLLALHGNRLTINVPVAVADSLWFASAGSNQTAPTSRTFLALDGVQASSPVVIEVHEVKGPQSSSTVWRFRVVSG